MHSKKANDKRTRVKPVDTKKVEVDGVVIENLQDTKYLVEIQMGSYTHKLTAYPAGKMRTYYRGRILVGDKVKIELDPEYNIDIGRILFKYSPNKPRIGAEVKTV
jgi:translation initiation factor IF-1